VDGGGSIVCVGQCGSLTVLLNSSASRRHIVHRMSAGPVDSIRGVGRGLSQS